MKKHLVRRRLSPFLLPAPILLLALSGCISLPSSGAKDASSIYTLRAPEAAPDMTRARGNAVVAIAKPELPAGFATQRIALYLEQGRRLDFYADAKWSASLDELLQEFVIARAKQKLGKTAVGTPDLSPGAKYRLALKFTDFEPVYADTPDKIPRLDVGMTVTVLALPGETVKTQFSVKKSVTASANTQTAITNELAGLLQSVTDEALEKAAPYL